MIKINNPELLTKLPNAILFDTDNTLYSYNEANEAAIIAVRKKTKQMLSISTSEFDEAYDNARSSVKSMLGSTASSHSRLLYIQRMLEHMGLGSQVLLSLDLEQTYWRSFLANANLFNGVKELLDDIRIAGIPTAIVTDLTAQIQFRKIIYFGLDSYFDHIVTSEETGADKPNESMFKLSLEKMKPEGTCFWMIGDNPISDIKGSRESIGAITFQKIHDDLKEGSGEYTPDVVFKDFFSLRDIFQKVLNNEKPR
ncbi:MAG: hydrolase [Euryarchaeota archaeon]|jgi:putative hydrolase of the HAD superfamily|nr:hydrolase [Euryarchaeota archaeon]|tara:strand:+ start:16865 stop:17626 length:762 start_codon:yes stop_codon:yes gene_type:complete